MEEEISQVEVVFRIGFALLCFWGIYQLGIAQHQLHQITDIAINLLQ